MFVEKSSFTDVKLKIEYTQGIVRPWRGKIDACGGVGRCLPPRIFSIML